jgi:hypothetical protein
MSVLRLRKPNKYGQWGLEVTPRVPTTDAARTLDTILTTATDAELAAYMTARAKLNPGKVWDGYFKPMLEAMDMRTRDEVLSNLTDYGNELSKSKSIGETQAGGLQFGGENHDEKEDEKKPLMALLVTVSLTTTTSPGLAMPCGSGAARTTTGSPPCNRRIPISGRNE